MVKQVVKKKKVWKPECRGRPTIKPLYREGGLCCIDKRRQVRKGNPSEGRKADSHHTSEKVQKTKGWLLESTMPTGEFPTNGFLIQTIVLGHAPKSGVNTVGVKPKTVKAYRLGDQPYL